MNGSAEMRRIEVVELVGAEEQEDVRATFGGVWRLAARRGDVADGAERVDTVDGSGDDGGRGYDAAMATTALGNGDGRGGRWESEGEWGIRTGMCTRGPRWPLIPPQRCSGGASEVVRQGRARARALGRPPAKPI